MAAWLEYVELGGGTDHVRVVSQASSHESLLELCHLTDRVVSYKPDATCNGLAFLSLRTLAICMWTPNELYIYQRPDDYLDRCQ
jgi:hypothetical protein